MKKKELNKLTKAQAIKNLDNMKKDLFNLRFQKINQRPSREKNSNSEERFI